MNAWIRFQKARLRINSAANRWRHCHYYGLAILLLLTGCSKVAPAGEQEFYEVRERNAHPAIQRHLEQLREQIKSQGLTFKIGYTTALDRRIADLIGTKPPPNLAALIQRQNEAATKLLEIDVATSKEFADQMGSRFVLPEYLIKPKCSATSKSFDWRKAGAVTGVRQQQCGNCWAYASMAALEARYLIRNTWTIDGSEQYIVNCAVDKDGNDAGTCSGGWHAGVFDYLISDGVATEASLADTGTDSTCNTGLPASYRAVVWDYVPAQPLAAGFESSLPTVDAMKQALCEHGPLAAAVLATDTFQVYTDDVFKEVLPDSTLTPVDPNTGKKFHSVNHDVLVIGWDDAKGAWLIKNSWGSGWGNTAGLGTERGYMWIAYGSNNIGLGAAWVHARNNFYKLPPKYFEQIRVKPFPDPGPLRFEETFGERF
jgi:cathepsin L